MHDALHTQQQQQPASRYSYLQSNGPDKIILRLFATAPTLVYLPRSGNSCSFALLAALLRGFSYSCNLFHVLSIDAIPIPGLSSLLT